MRRFGIHVTVEVSYADKQTDLQRPILTSSYRDRESAERAYNAIAARGYKPDEIHVLMSDETRKRLSTRTATA